MIKFTSPGVKNAFESVLPKGKTVAPAAQPKKINRGADIALDRNGRRCVPVVPRVMNVKGKLQAPLTQRSDCGLQIEGKDTKQKTADKRRSMKKAGI